MSEHAEIDEQSLEFLIDEMESRVFDIRMVDKHGYWEPDSEWQAISHFEQEPKERIIGRGETVIDCLEMACCEHEWQRIEIDGHEAEELWDHCVKCGAFEWDVYPYERK